MRGWVNVWSHSRIRRLVRVAAAGAVVCMLAACSGRAAPPPALPEPPPAEPPAAATPKPPIAPTRPAAPTDPVPTDTGWMTAARGIEYRKLVTPHHSWLVPVHLVRLDPAQVQFRVGYAPQSPRLIGDWCSQPGVVAAINGGFFDQAYESTALVVQDGVPSGSSYQGQGGMFAVDAGGTLTLRHLADQPYTADEPLVEAMQGWPMLIKPGRVLAYAVPSDLDRARRTALGVDTSGRVLFIVTPTSDFTLSELAAWLYHSDLALDAAVNLDGGSSTGFCLQTPGVSDRVDAFAPLPLMLLVSSR